jgi:hypothetical protein
VDGRLGKARADNHLDRFALGPSVELDQRMLVKAQLLLYALEARGNHGSDCSRGNIDAGDALAFSGLPPTARRSSANGLPQASVSAARTALRGIPRAGYSVKQEMDDSRILTSLNPTAISADRATSSSPATETSRLGRRLFLALGAIALMYAFLAGLRTVSDPDLGWQLATGRWVAQHHQVFSTDVFSYTSDGEPWIYPVGSGLIFYGVYLLGGFALISWMGAAACVGSVALLLRRGSAVSAAIAVLAVPLIAARTAPRADMFTVVLFRLVALRCGCCPC